MAGNARFDSNSASPEDLAYVVNYPDGQKGNYVNAGLDRYGSFRESTESRMFNSGASTSRGTASSAGDMPPITQCLIMDPISLGDQKYSRLGEVRRVLGISHGNTSEENSFGAAHTKLLTPVATEELKRFKASVFDSSLKARGRAKRLNEYLQKLNKYSDALNSNKQKRNDSFTSERSGGLNILKMGVQSHRNPSDLGSPRLEDRTKSLVLQKRVRSSVAELRADGRSQNIVRQSLVIGKDREMLRDGGEGSDVVEEKIRRLPTGGEGWDKKMRRKRSVGTVSTRPTDGNGESKRIMHYKLNSEPGLQSSDAQDFRVEQVSNLRAILLGFEAISGLRVNLSKSMIIPLGSASNIEVLAEVLGCGICNLPTKYLGLPLGAKHKDLGIWNPLVTSFEKKLSGWRRNSLSKAGRLTLIKSSLSNLPVYMMSLFPIPASIARKIESIMCRFLWGDSLVNKKMHLVKWISVKLPKEIGGLGIKCLSTFNKALLGKWLWRFSSDRDLFWRKIIACKYGTENNGWSTKQNRDSYGCSLWKSIRKGWDVWSASTHFQVGRGNSISFWNDLWTGDNTIRDSFANLYSLATMKDAYISQLYHSTDRGMTWNISFTRDAQDWEEVTFINFWKFIYSTKINPSMEDKICWNLASNKLFSVSSFYNDLLKYKFHLGNSDFPWRWIWKSKAPPKVNFFCWEAVWGRILTMDNLQRRGITLVNRCCLCKAELESINHLLLHCSWSTRVWANAISLLDIYWVSHSSVDKELAAWISIGNGKHQRSFVQLIPMSMMWLIWLERNNRIFNNIETSLDIFIERWFDCIKSWCFPFARNIFDLVKLSPM